MKRTLFYPCCGRDVRESIISWQHLIDDFWFAETTFSRTRKLKSGEIEIRWNVPTFQPPYLELISENESTLTGSTGEVSPVKTLKYLHKTLNKTISHNFVAGCAVDAFNRLPVDTISIFVNRGDYPVDGEGSSGICWLSDKGSSPHPDGMLQKVLSKLELGGYIVSDGSNADKALAPYFDERNFATDIHLSVNPVSVHGVQLRCVGMMKPKYGPTLVWQTVG